MRTVLWADQSCCENFLAMPSSGAQWNSQQNIPLKHLHVTMSWRHGCIYSQGSARALGLLWDLDHLEHRDGQANRKFNTVPHCKSPCLTRKLESCRLIRCRNTHEHSKFMPFVHNGKSAWTILRTEKCVNLPTISVVSGLPFIGISEFTTDLTKNVCNASGSTISAL